MSAASKKKGKRVLGSLLEYALSLPGAYEDHPWGDLVVKVDKKIFAFLGEDQSGSPAATLKLPSSGDAALSIAGARPTAYGLGKAGWVTMPLDTTAPPLEILREWVEESYRAVARKTRLRELDAR